MLTKWISAARGTVAVVLAALLTVAGMGQAHAAPPTSPAEWRARAIHFQAVGNIVQRDLSLNSVADLSDWSGTLWKDFLTSWGEINQAMPMNTSVPKGLPAEGHVFIVLGSALSSSGKVTATLERRLKLAVKALAAYPASKVVVTGGKPKQGKTEAAVMKAWLVDHGVRSSRILTEDKSSNTIGNAKKTMALLAGSTRYTSYTLITDAGHMRRSSVLFRAATMEIEERTGKRWAIRPVANLAYPDMQAGKVPLSAASVAYTATEVASLFGVLTEYKKVVANPPKPGADDPPAKVATKATSKVALKPSSTTPKRSKTRVVVKVTVTTGASKVVPTGTVTFYLDGKKLKAVPLAKAKKGKLSFTYPTIAKAGKHKLTVKYGGTSKLTSASRTITVTVKK